MRFYINKLGFVLVEDTPLNSEKRWVVSKPGKTNGQGCNLLLSKASNPNQKNLIGNQTRGRVFLFLYTDNFKRYYELILKNSVEIVRPPKEESNDKVLVLVTCMVSFGI